MNNRIWERKYPPIKLKDIVLIDVHPDLQKKLKIKVIELGAPSYSEGINFLIDFHEKTKKEEVQENESRNVKKDT